MWERWGGKEGSGVGNFTMDRDGAEEAGWRSFVKQKVFERENVLQLRVCAKRIR